MAYVDEGPPTGPPVLMLHGEPTWSYLYRHIIPGVAGAGYRVIAPDLVGFGRSDKPTLREDYSYQSHVDWVASFLQRLGLGHITLVCHDWGGLIGLRLVAEDGDRFDSVIAANTFLPTGDIPASESFERWRRYTQETPEFRVGSTISRGCLRDLTIDEMAAYDAPFVDETYKAGVRRFPMLVPTTPDDPASAANRKAWEQLSRWTKPFHTAFSDSDPITKGGDDFMQRVIPGAAHDRHVTIEGAGHFLQEDDPVSFTKAILRFAPK